MNQNLFHLTFRDANGKIIPYDGSPLAWRVSAYARIIKDNQVLIVKSKLEEMHDLPGGGVDDGEKIEEALKREAMEEAGINIKINYLIKYHQEYFYHRKEDHFYQTLLFYFQAEQIGEQRKPTDPNINFAEYVKLDDLEQYPMLDFVQEVIRESKDFR